VTGSRASERSEATLGRSFISVPGVEFKLLHLNKHNPVGRVVFICVTNSEKEEYMQFLKKTILLWLMKILTHPCPPWSLYMDAGWIIPH
jgi:hypothetical protein